MQKNKGTIRRERPADYAAVEQLTREAFWNVYRPGCMEHYVVHVLRDDPAFVPELDLVLEREGQLIGHVLYMRAQLHTVPAVPERMMLLSRNTRLRPHPSGDDLWPHQYPP